MWIDVERRYYTEQNCRTNINAWKLQNNSFSIGSEMWQLKKILQQD